MRFRFWYILDTIVPAKGLAVKEKEFHYSLSENRCSIDGVPKITPNTQTTPNTQFTLNTLDIICGLQ